VRTAKPHGPGCHRRVTNGDSRVTYGLVAAWLLARSGVTLAPAWYLAGAGALSFAGALLLPSSARHSLTKEFDAARFR